MANILEGSVRRSGNRIRVTAQLITAADGSQLRSERYERELAEIFAVQDEISAAIAGTLHAKRPGRGLKPKHCTSRPLPSILNTVWLRLALQSTFTVARSRV